MPIDVTAARAATPGCQDLIHFNNAGAALPTHAVLATQIDYLQLEARIGGYEAFAHEQARIDEIRPTIARLIGADPSGDEIALTVNNTAAFDLFLYSWGSGGESPRGGCRHRRRRWASIWIRQAPAMDLGPFVDEADPGLPPGRHRRG